MLDISWLFAGFEEFKKIVIRNSAVKIAGIVLLFTAVKTKNDIALYIGILSASSFLGNLSMWTYLKKYVDPPKFKEMDLKVHFKETMVFFVPTIATSVYTVLDKVMIGFLVEGNYENGYYEQATKIIQIAKTIIFSLNTVMGSRMAYLFGQKKDQEIRSKLHGCMDFILFIGMAMSFGIAGIAPIFVTWYFGTGFETVVQVLMVLSPIIVIIGISNCLGVLYFTPAGRNRETNRIICLGALVNLCLNLILIPKFASSGAAIASVFAELVITMLFVKKGQDYMSLGQLFSYTWKRVLAGFLMYAGIRFLPKILGWQTLWMTIFQVGMGAVIYVGILLILRDQMLIKSLKKLLHR